MNEQFVYCCAEESHWYDCENDAIQDLIDSVLECEDIKAGDTLSIYRGNPYPKKAGDFLTEHNVKSLIEAISESAYEEFGEIAECITHNISEQSKIELLTLLKEWADNAIITNFMEVKNIEEFPVIVTEEMLD